MPFNRIHLIRQVDLFTLKLYLSAVEEGQIGRAALRENISASAATKRIQDLEEIADIKLFERTPAGVTPTAAGRVLERYVRSIFGQLDDMRTEIAMFSEGVRGEIVIASARSIIVPFLAKQLGEFRVEFPMVEIIVRELENARIVQAVVSGEASIGVFVAAQGLDLKEVDVTPFCDDRIVAVVPRTHHLADRASVAFEDMLQEDLIPVRGMLGALETAAARLKKTLRPKFVVQSAAVATSLVQAGLGVTIEPDCLVSRAASDGVAVIELVEPWARRQIQIATAKGRAPSRAVQALIRQLLEQPGNHQS